MKVEESLNVTFDETLPPSKTSPLEDDDLVEEEAIEVSKTRPLGNNLKDKSFENNEIINIKESKSHLLENVIEPKNINEALKDESWVIAMQEELNQFVSNDVWELVPNPMDMTIIGTKWVFRNKFDENGVVSRNKARLVAQRYNQQERIDYDETYAPVARLESIRILLAYVCALDFKSAFLNGFINEEVYVEQPPRFIDFAKPNHVNRLKKALYGVNQAPKAWESVSKTDERIDKLADQISTLVEIVSKKVVTPAPVKAVEEICVTCSGPPSSGTIVLIPITINLVFVRQRDLRFDISFADALLLMPRFAPTIRNFLMNKEKLLELAKIPLNENCSVMLLKKLPEKLGDPGKNEGVDFEAELIEIKLLLNRDSSTNFSPTFTIDTNPKKFTDNLHSLLNVHDECFDPGGDNDEINAFLAIKISTYIEEGYYDSDGDVFYLERLLVNDTTHKLFPEVLFNYEPQCFKDESELDTLENMVKFFDPGIWGKLILLMCEIYHLRTTLSFYYNWLSKSFNLLMLTFFSPFRSEETIFDPRIFAFHFLAQEPCAVKCSMEFCFSTCFIPKDE
ncbi:retrovirus-related pol polyprotein from transposon TNT 1-94 [Tanacetum coccineum]